MRAKALGLTGTGAEFTVDAGVTDGTDSSGVENGLDVSNFENASKAITTLDEAINTVSDERSKLGAYQNRLEHTINNLSTSSENLTSAESRIRDVDMAKEMMTFSKENILQQAAQAMLAQAKQQPQGVLQLLR
ncbi:flagellin [Clostridium aestuarii]|uniref:Flagellin n=1 Tax=Clostridium aestuarii TaxID=338193 RepID=A0ABT4CXD8_9CLOT|nr:flagellin [Clostridium aestuarii]MCY6483664.1 flagellin [Clostridium aestuarii]